MFLKNITIHQHNFPNVFMAYRRLPFPFYSFKIRALKLWPRRPESCKRCHTAQQVFLETTQINLLPRLGIRGVVNCAPNLPNHHEATISYLRFPIGKWKKYSGEDDALLEDFVTTFLQVNNIITHSARMRAGFCPTVLSKF